MSDAKSPPPARFDDLRALVRIGPLVPAESWGLRYAAAIAVVLVTIGLRAALAPLLGTQAPLLPFVLAVLVSAWIGGLGPGLLASVLTPVAATIWFTAWPHDSPPLQWAAHVLFFLLISALSALLMSALQRSSRDQLAALRVAAENADRAGQSAAQLQLIADAVPALISYIAADGTYRFANKLYETWFGTQAEKLNGRHVKDLLGAAAFEVIRPRLARAFEGTRVFFEQQIPFVGGAREVAVHYIPDVDAGGKVLGVVSLTEDVSARKRAVKSLREADRRKDDFLAILAHELRNPLTPIRNVAYILGRGSHDAGTVRRAGDLLERQVNHMARLVDDLLDVTRIMRGRTELNRSSVEIGAVVGAALETVRPQLDARRQKVGLTREDESLFVNGDTVRLYQVVANLLGNAVKYSPEGAQIHVTLHGTADQVILSVRDEGVGIDPQMLPHIFDQFLQGDRSVDRAQGGLGIGLTIVRHVVEMHGGQVQARSAGLGCGSEFLVRLPRAESEPEVLPPDGDSRRQPVRRRVLVVDDDRDAAESLRELLRLDGHEAEVVHDGAHALSRLDEFPADIVLLDLGLPRVDGFMVAHAIRARYAHAHVRPTLLALTGHGREEDRLMALRSGFDALLTKPVEPEKLLQIIADDRLHATSGE